MEVVREVPVDRLVEVVREVPVEVVKEIEVPAEVPFKYYVNDNGQINSAACIKKVSCLISSLGRM